MKFSNHGNIDIHWTNNILVCRPTGAINLEGAEGMVALIEEKISGKNFKQWSRIEILDDQEVLGTPDAHKILKQHIESTVNNGCVFIALVKESPLNAYIFKEICQSLKIPVKSFSSEAIAIDYINQTYRE
ncbi:MAG: hypothetical protein OQK09_07140 [Colwellia sp.]|nr:hypothetical protein [Colwellia sp.]MCW8863289.1 hypothetical protein [Colwellia sp.]MCW9081272.1 hypothetical protein [Colwellia sp.]